VEELVNSFWQDKVVFVTGGTGFVGSHLTKRLIDLGANVIVPVRGSNFRSYFFSTKLNEKTILVNCDIKDFQRVKDIIVKYDVKVVFHLAAQSLVTVAKKEPFETLMTNISGTINVLESCRLNPDVEAILLASSDKAYGTSPILPYLETCSLKGDYPYDVSKSCMDLISQCYYKTYSMPLAIARFGNIYGEGDLNFNRIVPGGIKAGLLDSTLDIRSDGNMVREYLYVQDVVNGYLAMAENIGNIKGEAFNFSSIEKLRVVEVIDSISKAMNKNISRKILGIANCEINEQCLSSEKAKRLLNWKCQYKLDSILPKIIDWYRQYFNSQ
jgi:CDP-glucose 4,6-dehydratase